MAKAKKSVEIPLSHYVIRQNVSFADALAERILNGEWTEDDLREFLEGCAYRPDTADRFIRAVRIRLKAHAREHPANVKEDSLRGRAKRPASAPTPEEDSAAKGHDKD
jgi:hypothetical protein